MSRYRDLTFHLANLEQGEWTASFEEIERILRMPLPDSASKYAAWWANQGRAQSLAWESAGWKTSRVDIPNQRVTFVYVADQPERSTPELSEAAKLTIAEAKAGLAANFNVPVDAIEITIRG